MKKLWKMFKTWLIHKLGGYTIEEIHKRCGDHVGDFTKFHTQTMDRWRKAVQEICRKSENSYYDWCCDYCVVVCDKHNGWCRRFAPKIVIKESEADNEWE